MKQPFYPAEWAIRIAATEQKPKPLIYGNSDLHTREAMEYYSYRNRINQGDKNEGTNRGIT